MRGRLAPLAALAALLLACDPKDAPRVVVIGIDGMDPQLLRSYMDAGKMPHFAALAKEGVFTPLGTSNPPQSPVAWSNMITGMDPGGHGVFDFVHRDPKTYEPKTSFADTDPVGHEIKLFGYKIPLTGGATHNTRQGEAFWQILEAHGIPAAVYRMPSNYPPVKTKEMTLSGMGTPDLFGGYGTYQVFTEKPLDDLPHNGIVHDLRFKDGRAATSLRGPDNPYVEADAHGTLRTSYTDMVIAVDPENHSAKIEVCGEDVLLKEGEWSDWVPVSFELIPLVGTAGGMCRFYLKSVAPLLLFASPINIDPLAPATPISTPADACEKIAKDVGRFFTKGMPEETKALQEGILDDEDFVRQGKLVMEDSRRLLDHALAQFKSGLLFFYFSSIDLNCHMLWRHIDPDHPRYDAKLAARFGKCIEDLYVEMDHVLGDLRAKLPPDTTLIVMSDHGFASFRREMNVNTWLMEKGYLVLKPEAQKQLDEAKMAGVKKLNEPNAPPAVSPYLALPIATAVDWSKTKAYSIGFNGIYLNVKDRERDGIVADGAERQALAMELHEKLIVERDPKTGDRYIPAAYLATEIYHGDHVAEGPDLVVGFDRGYGASDASCQGQVEKRVLDDRSDLWSGNHLMAPDVVPGILLANRKLAREKPVLQDITVTILNLYGIEKLPKMTGAAIIAP